MIESKYYTPSIKEFRVGFECETNYCLFNKEYSSLEFVPLLLTDSNISVFHDSYKHDAYSTEFRVKYLDREDIESLGFTDYIPPREYAHTWSKGPWEIVVWFNQYIDRVQIEPMVRINHTGTMFFHGSIKNKSELKVLLKQLGVDE
jgi:hypothetical protein